MSDDFDGEFDDGLIREIIVSKLKLPVKKVVFISNPFPPSWITKAFLEQAKMKTGRVKKRMDKGFGFIEADGDEYFFHTSQCVTRFDNLAAGDKVRFNTEDSPKGPRAVDVERI